MIYFLIAGEAFPQYNDFLIEIDPRHLKPAISVFENWEEDLKMVMLHYVLNLTKYSPDVLEENYSKRTPEWREWCDNLLYFYCCRYVLDGRLIPITSKKGKEELIEEIKEEIKKLESYKKNRDKDITHNDKDDIGDSNDDKESNKDDIGDINKDKDITNNKDDIGDSNKDKDITHNNKDDKNNDTNLDKDYKELVVQEEKKDNNQSEVKIPSKRGRKPKNKEETKESESSSDVKSVKSKRGRKPKSELIKNAENAENAQND